MKKIPSAIAIDGDAGALSIQTQLNGEYSLYIHVPFCTKKCDYCHFYVIPDKDLHKDLYLEALQQEWRFRSPCIPPTWRCISVYFGGGTPFLLGPKKIEKILSWLDLSEDCEITLEANPENITPEAMRDFNQCGINRVSIGVQSLENTLLKKLGRTHTAQEAIKAIYATAEAGFHNICIDLMYDLPDQTLFHWQSTLEQALPLPISHLSLYNLTVEPHTVFFKKRTSLRLPDSDTSFQMLKMALSFLEAAAFRRYEISAFSRKEHVSCHNIGYWTGRPFLGLGPSASSFWNGSRFRNFSNLSHYSKALANGLEPLEFKETLEKKELHKEQIAIGLRMLAGIPLSKIDPTFKKQIENLEKNGFVEKTDFSLRLTEQGLLFHDTIAEEIMSF